MLGIVIVQFIFRGSIRSNKIGQKCH